MGAVVSRLVCTGNLEQLFGLALGVLLGSVMLVFLHGGCHSGLPGPILLQGRLCSCAATAMVPQGCPALLCCGMRQPAVGCLHPGQATLLAKAAVGHTPLQGGRAARSGWPPSSSRLTRKAEKQIYTKSSGLTRPNQNRPKQAEIIFYASSPFPYNSPWFLRRPPQATQAAIASCMPLLQIPLIPYDPRRGHRAP